MSPSVPCLTSPVPISTQSCHPGGFPLPPCSLSRALKVMQATGATLPDLAVQPKLHCCALLWLSAPFPPFLHSCSTSSSFPGAAAWLYRLQEEQPHATGMHVPGMPMRSEAGAGSSAWDVPKQSHSAGTVLWFPSKQEMQSHLAATATFQAFFLEADSPAELSHLCPCCGPK